MMAGTVARTPGPFADYVRERREALGLSIVEMSERSDIPQNYISQIESGRILFPRRYLPNFARALGVTELDLLRVGGYAPAEEGADRLDPSETAMLMTWRDLDETNRDVVAEMARLLARKQTEGSR